MATKAARRASGRDYLDLVTERFAADNFTRGSLIGDFSLEAAAQSALLRDRLAAIFAERGALFGACVAEAQVLGEIDATFTAIDLAEFLPAS